MRQGPCIRRKRRRAKTKASQVFQIGLRQVHPTSVLDPSLFLKHGRSARAEANSRNQNSKQDEQKQPHRDSQATTAMSLELRSAEIHNRRRLSSDRGTKQPSHRHFQATERTKGLAHSQNAANRCGGTKFGKETFAARRASICADRIPENVVSALPLAVERVMTKFSQ